MYFYLVLPSRKGFYQGGKGHLAVHYASRQSFIIMFSYSFALTTLETFIEFDWLVLQATCPSVSTPNCNLQKE